MTIPRIKDPFLAFKYKVEIKGIIVGGFSEVSGMRIETEFDTIREGGENSFVHKLPKSTKFSEITLKRGITDWTLYSWYMEVVYGKITRTSGSIILQEPGTDMNMTWHFFDAFPIKWEGPTFNASGNSIATETLTLAHNGLKKFLK